jgi:hypothetical protein
MIVGLEIDPSLYKVILIKKDLWGSKYETNANLSKLRLAAGYHKDVITGNSFRCYLFVHKKQIIGRLYLDHFTFTDKIMLEEISSKIRMVGNNTV